MAVSITSYTMANTSANTRSSFIGACMLCDNSVLIDVERETIVLLCVYCAATRSDQRRKMTVMSTYEVYILVVQ